MKTIVSILAIYLMTDGGSCRQAQFIENSRIVVEGRVLDSLHNPINNIDVSYSNKINSGVCVSKKDGSFFFSMPKTNVNTTLEATDYTLLSFESKQDSLKILYSKTLVLPKSATYVYVNLITKKP